MNWIRNQDEAGYGVNLQQSRINIVYLRPKVAPDFIRLAFSNAEGVLVGALSADKPEPDDAEPNPDWPLLEALYSEVHRSVTGWDKVLNEIETALAGPGPIGQPPGLTSTISKAVGAVHSVLER